MNCCPSRFSSSVESTPAEVSPRSGRALVDWAREGVPAISAPSSSAPASHAAQRRCPDPVAVRTLARSAVGWVAVNDLLAVAWAEG